ncbi:MAG TPA: FecR family protein [Bryobacteraceae bacterium]|nr:FecR family protein [Bryobacteraceae bacterium]
MARAQNAPPQDSGAPERGVARISIVSGEVSVRRGDSGDWVAAVVNAPLMVEDRVSTGTGSRAEVQFDSANLIRIGAHAEIRLAQLDPARYNVQLAHGTVTFRMLRDSQAQVELDTPTVSVRPAHVGVYRIYVQEDGQTEITVRLGSVEIFTPRGSQQLQAGQTMLARGTAADPEFRIVPAIAYDEWDRWNEQRDQELQNSQSYQNVPPDVYGAEDLDNRGQWVNDPSYGEVWAPSVGPDWAPYQNGRWVWEDYYGWTWVSYDPWGWAPFHYGRWFYAPVGWCWYPGGFFGRHYWSPGLVAFFGFGPGVGVGFGFGNVGWVALAPFEPLYAWWGRGFYAGYRNPAYFNRNVNITSVNIQNIYRNARVNNAVATVSAGDFRQGRFSNIVRATGSQIHDAGLVRGQLPVAPSAANLRYSNRAVAIMPRSSDNVHFFSRSSPAPVQRVPFSEQQRAMQQFSRQPAPALAHSATPRPAAGPAVANGGGAWRPSNAPPAAAPGNPASSGWQRFGEPRPVSTWTVPKPAYAQPGAATYRPPSTPSTAGGSRPQSIRVAPPVVRERQATTRSTSSSTGSTSHATHSSGGSSGSGGGSHASSHR